MKDVKQKVKQGKQQRDFVFFGTPQFAVYVLEELEATGYLPSLVVTAPDRPAGRGLKITPPPVKVWALARHIPVLQPEMLDSDFLGQLSNVHGQMCIVAAYGRMIPRSVLSRYPLDILNVHPSLLPRYRGTSPVSSQILGNDPATGVSIIRIDEKMDHGPIIAQEKVTSPVWPPRASELNELLWRTGGKLLAEVLPQYMRGDLVVHEQDHGSATYTQKITKEDGYVDLAADDPWQIFLKIKAFDPWPGTYFFAKRGEKQVRVKIKDATWEDGVLRITRVVPEGGREMSYDAFFKQSPLHSA